MPLVSVVIPVHNGGVYLRQSVSSALSQTMHKIEVIVLDDGSTDGCIDLMLQDEEISGDRRLRLKRFQVAGIRGDCSTNSCAFVAIVVLFRFIFLTVLDSRLMTPCAREIY